MLGHREDPAWVSLWQLTKGKWFQITQVQARNGTYSGKLNTTYLKEKMKMGGTLQAAIRAGASGGSGYT